MKVNPNLVVEVKPNQVPREMRNEIARKLRAQRMHVIPYVLHCLPDSLFLHHIWLFGTAGKHKTFSEYRV